MTSNPTDDLEFCPHCFARAVSAKVLSGFTDAAPEVTMSYDNWCFLGFLIEEEIKKGLGIETEEEEAAKETHEGHTVQ